MKAPPLSIEAPDAFTLFAIFITCSSLSTEQGPAIITGFSPPIFIPLTSTIVSSFLNALFALLNGSCTFNTLSTPGNVAINSLSTF